MVSVLEHQFTGRGFKSPPGQKVSDLSYEVGTLTAHSWWEDSTAKMRNDQSTCYVEAKKL